VNIKSVFCGLLLCVGLIGCGTSEKPADLDLAAIKAYTKAEVATERMRKQESPDWAAIRAQYEITSAIVKEIDTKFGTDYDREIREALKKCAAGEKVKVNQQVLAKGLQHVTALLITRELNKMGGSSAPERKDAAERISACFEGIRPTFVRRDKDFFGGEKTLEASADMALKRLSEADSGGLLAARRELEDVIARTYALCVLYEIEEVERLRDSNREECDVKRREAEIFYRIIEARVKKRSQKTYEIISNMLSGSYDIMDAKALENYLKAGLGGIALR
jgi:hypothetical protein